MDQNNATRRDVSTSRLYRAYKSGDAETAKGLHPADRNEARAIMARLPGVVTSAKANVAMLRRAVDAAGRDGVDQIIDIGCDLPSEGAPPLHDVLRAHHPEAHSALVDHDTYVVTHAAALLAGDAKRAAVVLADAREPERLVAAVRTTGIIDFDRPVCVVMGALLHFIGDDEVDGRGPAGVVAALADAVAPGSWIITTNGCSDLNPEGAATAAELYRSLGLHLYTRTRGDIERMMRPTRLLEPGIAPFAEWRPDLHTTRYSREEAAGWAAVGVVD